MKSALNLEETLAILKKNRVPESMYCIGGRGKGESVGISNENGQWETYYSERGTKTSVKTHANENDACVAFLQRLELHFKDRTPKLLPKMDEFRHEMTSYRLKVDNEGKSFKDPHIAIERLQSLYKEFDVDERKMADHILGEWVLSEDEGFRFDALALIDNFKIVSAASALQTLASRLVSSIAPSAPFELKKVNRVLERLATTHD